jgi:hypothetical protein
VYRIKIALVDDNHSWTQLRRFQHSSLLRPASQTSTLASALYFGKGRRNRRHVRELSGWRRILAHAAALPLLRLNKFGGPTKTRVSLPRLFRLYPSPQSTVKPPWACQGAMPTRMGAIRRAARACIAIFTS